MKQKQSYRYRKQSMVIKGERRETNWEIGTDIHTLCCAQLLSCIRLFATPWTVAHQVPLSVGILQARILEWVAISYSRGSSQPRNGICVSIIGRQILQHNDTWEAHSQCICVSKHCFTSSIYITFICQLYFNKADIIFKNFKLKNFKFNLEKKRNENRVIDED